MPIVVMFILDAPSVSSGLMTLPLWHNDAVSGGGVHTIALWRASSRPVVAESSRFDSGRSMPLSTLSCLSCPREADIRGLALRLNTGHWQVIAPASRAAAAPGPLEVPDPARFPRDAPEFRWL